MKIRKTVTPAKLAANRRNGRKPKRKLNLKAKAAAKFSALTHGFYAKELILTKEESRQLEALRAPLHRQLSPETILQEAAFEDVLICMARRKLALRVEMLHVGKMLVASDKQKSSPGCPREAGASMEWYVAGKQALNEGIRLLERVRAEFLNLGRIDSKWHNSLDQVFGAQLRQRLSEWAPRNAEAAVVADMLTTHAERYNLPLSPNLLDQPASTEDGTTSPRVILDPGQCREMVLKLLDDKLLTLGDLSKSAELRASESAKSQNAAGEFAPRYFSTATRDWENALRRFVWLKKERL